MEVLAGGKHILTVVDLCGDETVETRLGLLQAQSKKTTGDLVELRTLAVQSLKWKFMSGDPIVGGLGCNLTREIARQLIHFPNIHVVFFCDGEGDVESVSRLCAEWKPRTGGGGGGGGKADGAEVV